MAYQLDVPLDEGSVLQLRGPTLRTHLNILHNDQPLGKMVYLLSKGKFEAEVDGHLVKIRYERQRGTGHIKLTVNVDGEQVRESYVRS